MEDEFREIAHRLATSDLVLKEDQLLQLYGLYKQASLGDCSMPQPWTSQKEEYAKWSAWFSNRGMLREDAMKKYIETAETYIL
jgi:diazepam-binding inhibitor (GABA receptor modulating acyl-CoA-binding protein)